MRWRDRWIQKGRILGRREFAIELYQVLIRHAKERWTEEALIRELRQRLDSPDGWEETTVEELMRELSHG